MYHVEYTSTDTRHNVPSLHTDMDGIDGAYNNVACTYVRIEYAVRIHNWIRLHNVQICMYEYEYSVHICTYRPEYSYGVCMYDMYSTSSVFDLSMYCTAHCTLQHYTPLLKIILK